MILEGRGWLLVCCVIYYIKYVNLLVQGGKVLIVLYEVGRVVGEMGWDEMN